jgi:hypothetical protein
MYGAVWVLALFAIVIMAASLVCFQLGVNALLRVQVGGQVSTPPPLLMHSLCRR